MAAAKKKRKFSAAQIAAQRRFAEMNRGRRGPARRGGTVQLSRHEDRSTPSAPSALQVRGVSLKIDKEVPVETSKRDALASAMGMLIAMRNASAGLTGKRDDLQRMALSWVRAPGSEGLGAHLSGVNLDAEINFFEDVFGAVPAAAEALGFAGAEWASAWDRLTSEARLDPIGAPDPGGEGFMVPPVNGVITSRFTADHPAIDIACEVGTPVRAPEDSVVQTIGRNASLGLHVVLASRLDDGSWPAPIRSGSTILKVHEGMRYHSFGHLSTVPTDLKEGDKVDAGHVVAHSGGAKGTDSTTKGPHVHWRAAIALDRDGAVKSLPVDPLDLVSEDAIAKRGPGRAPAPIWTIMEKGKPADIPGKSVVVHGDVIVGGSGDIISRGGGLKTGDIDADILSNPLLSSIDKFAVPSEDPFKKVNAGGAGAKLGEAAGGVVGAIYGPVGAAAGKAIGRQVGKLGDFLFAQGGK